MLVIGELINSTRGEIQKALKEKDESTIRRLVRAQVDAGADLLDINTATSRDQELSDMEWVIGLIYDEVGEKVRLCIDSPNPKAIEHGLSLCKSPPLINSITNDKKLQQKLIPLIDEYSAEFIGLPMGGGGMPMTVDARMEEAEMLISTLQAAEIPLNHLYIDPMVMTIGSNPEQAEAVRTTIKEVKGHWGKDGVKTSVGLSNISFGLPYRSIVNQSYLVLLLDAGLDAALIDPTDRGMMDILYGAEALLERDPHCLNYIKYMRKRKKGGK
ncbi:MAG: dihydropteroate synthase [Candidatus Bipolaricaulota bacterium]|nr:dihydropteroate synthase [Candidatus Bipolaricaulota bacterium]